MRFTSLELNNYIGIYNGMGLYNIKIDFSLATHRVQVIKGTNGSGKTTIMNALSLFPDSTDAFIPDRSASKIVGVYHKGHNYLIQFFHELKPNGTRETTKAFISKSNDNGVMIEMNQNGNVTSYRDILYSEFKLDPNFFALSKLSMDDRGLGYKKPAERKKFVNSIIESLEVYNDIYKTVSKKVSAVKAIMSSITTRLGALGDKASLEALKDSVERETNEIQRKIDEVKRIITEIDVEIRNIDPDASIQTSYKSKESELRKLNKELKEMIFGYHRQGMQMMFIPEVEAKALAEQLQKDYAANTYFKSEIERIRSINNGLINQIQSIKGQIDDIENQLSSLKSDEYNEVESYLNSAKQEAAQIAQTISVTGIDPNSFTKAEYIIALETVHEITRLVEDFKFMYDYHTIQECINEFAAINYVGMPSVIDTSRQQAVLDTKDQYNEKYLTAIAEADTNHKLAEKLKNRPSSCKIDSCFFISDAVKAAATNPAETLSELTNSYDIFKAQIDQYESEVKHAEVHNACLNAIRTIIRSIDKNHSILSRLPNGGIFESKAEFFETLLGGDELKYIDRIYQYIDLANYFEEYQIIIGNIQKYEAKLASLAGMKEGMKKFYDMKIQLEASLSALFRHSEANQRIVEHVQRALAVSEDRIHQINDYLIPKVDQILQTMQLYDSTKNELDQYKSQIDFIRNHEARRAEEVTRLKVYENDVSHKNRERDDLVYKLGQIADYEKSLESYQTEIKKYEKVKFYSSPTTGIQLVFMELYMGNILKLSNKLLSYLFGGQYQLQPFVINENEFRIPCIGNGYLNDDISSMSSSQLTMISMIISFALLKISSTEYNVIKVDEIDDPLDEPNRAAFALLMDNIMDLMETEQCIMISHSSEMIVSNADIILLRSDGIDIDKSTNNIIWYFNAN